MDVSLPFLGLGVKNIYTKNETEAPMNMNTCNYLEKSDSCC